MHGQRHALQGWMAHQSGHNVYRSKAAKPPWLKHGMMRLEERCIALRHRATSCRLSKPQSDHWIDNILAHYWARQAQHSEGKVWSVDRPSELQNTG